MQNEESQRVVKRFFAAIDILISSGKIRGKKTICDELVINRRNFYRLEKNPESDIFQVGWLTYLVRNYRFSPDWLLTGRGDVFS